MIEFEEFKNTYTNEGIEYLRKKYTWPEGDMENILRNEYMWHIVSQELSEEIIKKIVEEVIQYGEN